MTTTATTRLKVPTRFGPETRFVLTPTPPVPFRAVLEDEFERLTRRLLRERMAGNPDVRLNVELRRAANEAGALAWMTPFPLLFFPALFEEKARAAAARLRRQEIIRHETRELLAA